MIKKCEKCGHYKGGNCLLKKVKKEAEDSCSDYTESPYICEICGIHLLKQETIVTTGIKTAYHMVCQNCIKYVSSCNTCENAKNCRFENDNTIPEPAYVMRQIQQGPMITQTQIKNPKRINLTCKVNCPCFVNEECVKSDGSSCEKYKCSVPNW